MKAVKNRYVLCERIGNSGISRNNKGSAAKRVLILLTMIPVFLLIVAVGYIGGMISINRQYRIQIAALKTEIEGILSAQDSLLSKSDKPIPEILGDIRKLCRDSNPGRDLEEINNNPSYKWVKRKETENSLKIDVLENELNKMVQDIDDIMAILIKSQEIDKKILSQKQKKDTYKSIIDENNELKDKGKLLREMLLSLEVCDKIKPLQKRTADAMALRERSIDLYHEALVSELESSVAVQKFNECVEAVSKQINTAKNSYNLPGVYADSTMRAVENAREQERVVKENVKDTSAYYRQADEMFNKYNRVMGFATVNPDGNNKQPAE